MQVSHLLKVQLRKIRLRILNNIATFLELAGTEPRGRIMLHGIGPREVVEPSFSGNVPKNSTTINIARFTCSINVIYQFVVICSIEGGHMTMPFTQVTTTSKVGLIIFPNPDQRRRLLNNARRL